MSTLKACPFGVSAMSIVMPSAPLATMPAAAFYTHCVRAVAFVSRADSCAWPAGSQAEAPVGVTTLAPWRWAKQTCCMSYRVQAAVVIWPQLNEYHAWWHPSSSVRLQQGQG